MPLPSFQPEGKRKRKAVPLGELFSGGVQKIPVAELGEHESTALKNKTMKLSTEKKNQLNQMRLIRQRMTKSSCLFNEFGCSWKQGPLRWVALCCLLCFYLISWHFVYLGKYSSVWLLFSVTWTVCTPAARNKAQCN